MLSFEANIVSVEYNENGVLIIVFAAIKDGVPQNYFLIQDSDEDDERESDLGAETYYIERYEQGYSSYGGIASLKLAPSQLAIMLNDTGKWKLKVATIEITYTLAEMEYDNLKTGLQQVFGGKEYFFVD